MYYISVIATVLFWLCYLIILIKAFRDEMFQGIMCLLIPFYILYYGFARLQSERRGLILSTWLFSLFLGPAAQLVLPAFSKAAGACKLVTEADVEQALAEPVGKPKSDERTTRMGEMSVCAYTTTTEPQKELFFGVVKKQCTSLEPLRAMGEGNLLGLRGIGDEALYGGSWLLVRQQESCLLFRLEDHARPSGMTRDAKLEANLALARKALPRLSR